MEPESVNESVKEPKDKNKKKVSSTKIPKKVPNPDFDLSVFQNKPSKEIWSDYVKHRKELKKPLTQAAINGLAKQVNIANNNGHLTDDVLEEVMSRGWIGFKADWLKGEDEKKSNVTSLHDAINSHGWYQKHLENKILK